MILPRRILKLLITSAVGLSLAVICGAHGLSSASLRYSPESALSLFPANGLALEKVAYVKFVDDVKDDLTGAAQATLAVPGGQEKLMNEFQGRTSDLQPFAAYAIQVTRRAMALEPLLPKAHALLALAQTDLNKRKQIIALASQLNRRDLSLQSLVLQNNAESGDYAASIETLDQVLRVHPERQVDFFPLLVDALAQRETRGAFADLLRNDLPWRDAFLAFAVADPRTFENLASIRRANSFDNFVFDQKLIAGLVARGRVADAAAIYKLAVGPNHGVSTAWRSDYPPFDWKLSDTSGLRARANRSLDKLEFSIEPGNGGILASKLVPAPSSPFKISISLTNNPPLQIENLKLRISCWGQTSPFFERALVNGVSVSEIAQTTGCAYLQISIVGRAWTGSSALEGTLGPLEFSAL